MKIFTQQELSTMSKARLKDLADSIKVSDASLELKERNLAEVQIALNGGTKYTIKEVIEDIEAGQADISDIKLGG